MSLVRHAYGADNDDPEPQLYRGGGVCVYGEGMQPQPRRKLHERVHLE